MSHTPLMQEIGNLKKQTDYLEAQSRRNNLLFEGVEEKDGELWAQCDETLKSVMLKYLSQNIKEQLVFERVHRVGPKSTTRPKPRPIIWQNRFGFKGTKV